MNLPRISTISTLLWMSASLTACGGGAPMSNTVPAGANVAQVQPVLPSDRQVCQDEDGIKVLPCRVRFDANHTESRTVRITTGDNDRGVVKERDDCAIRNVATITQQTNHRYTVARGTASGDCTARFVRGDHNRMGHDDGRNGGGELEIVNAM